MKYVSAEQLFAVVTSDPGCGKSTLIRRLIHELPNEQYLCLYLSDSKLTPKWLYNGLIQQIGGIQKFYRGDAKLELQKEIELIRGLQNKNLLDQMVMDIQHLELEVIRARYKLSFFLRPPYDEYLRMEIFSSMGSRYGGDPVYDQYLSYCGLKEYDDAIDTPFHLKRKRRLAKGHDDYPDYYP